MRDDLVLQTLLELKEDLGSVKSDVKTLVALESRVIALEAKGNVAMGWVHAVGAAVSAVVAFIISSFSQK